jgi:ABC-type spermidine/putrescine transport system permease subunit II
MTAVEDTAAESRRSCKPAALLLPAGLLVGVLLVCSASVLRMSLGERNAEWNGWSLASYVALLDGRYLRLVADTIWLAFLCAIITTAISFPIALHDPRDRRGAARRVDCVMLPMVASPLVQSFGWMAILGPDVWRPASSQDRSARFRCCSPDRREAGLVQTTIPLAALRSPRRSARSPSSSRKRPACSAPAGRASTGTSSCRWHGWGLPPAPFSSGFNTGALAVPARRPKGDDDVVVIRDQMGPLLNCAGRRPLGRSVAPAGRAGAEQSGRRARPGGGIMNDAASIGRRESRRSSSCPPPYCSSCCSPIIVVVVMSFTPATTLYSRPGLSLRWYGDVWSMLAGENADGARLRDSLRPGRSPGPRLVRVAAGVPASYALVRCRFLGREPSRSRSVCPSSPDGRARHCCWPSSAGAGSDLGMAQHGTHAIVGLPFMMRNCMAAMQGMDPALEEAAKTLGASGVRAFAEIVLPLARGGIASGALLVFILSFNEFTLAYFLYTVDVFPLSIWLFQQSNTSFSPAIFAVSALMIFLNILIILALDMLIGNRARKSTGSRVL